MDVICSRPMFVILAFVVGGGPAFAARTRPQPRPQAGPPAAAEFRGMWVTRFEWPSSDQAQCRAKIDKILSTLARNHFNAAIFQVRGQADTFYPSPEEPWSPMISPSGTEPGWDPLGYAVEVAHRQGLEFHAYINTHTIWQHDRKEVPGVPSHLFYRRGDAATPGCHDWLIHDDQGRPVQWGGDNYVWLAPGVPAAQAYVRRQVMYVVQQYDIDGVHFDRIRTAGAEFSHDPISVSRQSLGSEGNPGNLDFGDWTRDQITRLLGDLYAQIGETKPRLMVSATPVGLYRQDRYPNYPDDFHYGYSKCYQDAQAWMVAGAVDLIVPQIYWNDGGKPPDFSQVLPDWIAHSGGRHVCAGLVSSMTDKEIIHQVQETRKRGGTGEVFFSYGSFNRKGYFRLFSRPGGLYAKQAATPSLPWKEWPTDGIVVGTLLDAASAEPVVDAWVVRTGSEHVALSSGDGLYSFLKVPPGTYALTIRKRGYAERLIDNVVVNAGQVVRVNAAMLRQPATQPAEMDERAAESQPAGPPQPSDILAADHSDASPPPRTPRGKGMGLFTWLGILLLAGSLSATLVLFLLRRTGRPEV